MVRRQHIRQHIFVNQDSDLEFMRLVDLKTPKGNAEMPAVVRLAKQWPLKRFQIFKEEEGGARVSVTMGGKLERFPGLKTLIKLTGNWKIWKAKK